MTQQQIAIIGGGLAGWSVAHQLIETGMSPANITLFDAHCPLKASDAPGALMHALPGRSLAFKPDTVDAYTQSVKWLDGWQHKSRAIYKHLEIARTIKEGKIGRRYINTYQRGRDNYPKWMAHRQLDAQALQEQYPDLEPHLGAVCYGPAYMVALPELIDDIAQTIQITHINAKVQHLQHNDGWQIRAASQSWSADVVVVCAGSYLGHWFPNLELTINGGELMTCTPPAQSHFAGVVSAGGHLGTMPDGRWVMGATYRREEGNPHDPKTWARSDEEARADIQALIGKLVPAITQQDGHIWRGCRAVCQPHRIPVAGRVPQARGLFVLGALGSKGLLWAPGLAKAIAQQIMDDRATGPDSVQPQRFITGSQTWQLRQ